MAARSTSRAPPASSTTARRRYTSWCRNGSIAAIYDTSTLDTGSSGDGLPLKSDRAVDRAGGGVVGPDRGAVALTAAKRIVAMRR